MAVKHYYSPKWYIAELGRKLKLYRIASGMTQEEMSEKTGVSVRSIGRLEQGQSIQLDNFIKILTALDLDANINVLVPDEAERPSYYVPKKKLPQRARKKEKQHPNNWKWGDGK